MRPHARRTARAGTDLAGQTFAPGVRSASSSLLLAAGSVTLDAHGDPFALALGARSNALQEFEGGPGQIALHGRDNLGGTVGAAESHGCVRIATAEIDWLSTRISPGMHVTIYGG
jgi:L,D-transpeptidase catalytic domain